MPCLKRTPDAPYGCCQYLLGDRLRKTGCGFDFASEQIRRSEDVASVGGSFRRVLRKFCILSMQLKIAFGDDDDTQITEELRRSVLRVEDVISTKITDFRDLTNRLNREIEQMQAAIKDLHPLLATLPKSSNMSDNLITGVDSISGVLDKLQREFVYIGIISLLQIWPVAVVQIEFVTSYLNGVREFFMSNSGPISCPTLLRLGEIRLKDLLLHVAEIKIENGSFGDVWLTPNVGRGSFGKVFKMTNVFSDERFRDVTREMAALEMLRHDFVVPFMGTRIVDHVSDEATDSNETMKDSEQLYDNGTLRDWLNRNNNNEDIEKSKVWLAQLADGLNYVHGQNMIHRDIKPENIFIGDDEQMIIGDFGLVWMPKAPEFRSEIVDQQGSNRTANRGTFKYMAPEVMGSSLSDNVVEYGNKADVYSLGQVYFDLLESDPSFRKYVNFAPSTCDSKEQTEQRARIEKDVKIASWLTRHDPADRPSCAELLQSNYLKDIDYKIRKPETVK